MKQIVPLPKNPPPPPPRKEFTIPFYPRLKKYIKVQYGFNVRKPIQLDEYTPIGKSVMLALRDNRLRAEYNDLYRDNLKEKVTFILTKEMMELSPKISKLMKLNIYLDLDFKQALLTWINAQSTTGIAPYTACQFFLEHYALEEHEYSLDAAYRYWQRSKEDEEQK